MSIFKLCHNIDENKKRRAGTRCFRDRFKDGDTLKVKNKPSDLSKFVDGLFFY